LYWRGVLGVGTFPRTFTLMKTELLSYLTILAIGFTSLTVSAQAPDARGGRGSRGPGGGRTDFDSTPMGKDEREKRILAVLAEMSAQGRQMLSVQRDDGRFLRMLVESMGAKQAVELGTSQGYSALWTALALGKTGGKLTTHEIDPGRADTARANFKKAGVEDLITVVVGDAHQELKRFKGVVDFVFLDADKEGYIDYLNTFLPLVRPGGLIVAHNINSRQADPRYIEAISKNPELETLFLAVGDGISVTMKKR
jgi:caffeoyl-CoA O-methyltransferase